MRTSQTTISLTIGSSPSSKTARQRAAAAGHAVQVVDDEGRVSEDPHRSTSVGIGRPVAVDSGSATRRRAIRSGGYPSGTVPTGIGSGPGSVSSARSARTHSTTISEVAHSGSRFGSLLREYVRH